MGKYRGLDIDPGWITRKLADLDRRINEQAAARRLGPNSEAIQAQLGVTPLTPSDIIQARVVQVDLDPQVLTATWTNYGTASLSSPPLFTMATIHVVATCGVSWPDNVGGEVGIQAVVASTLGEQQYNGRAPGVGGGAALSVTSSLAVRLPVVEGVPFNLKVRAYADTGYTAGTGNVRYSATIIYTQE